MTTISYTKSRPPAGNDHYTLVTWPSLAAGDEGLPLEFAQLADRTVQVAGDLDGATVQIMGSINSVDYHTLTDPQGNALAFTLPGLEAVTELVAYVKPVIVGGGGSTAATVTLLMKE